MFRIVITLAAGLLWMSATFCQSGFGIKAGATISNFSSSTYSGIVTDYLPLFGYTAKIFAEIPVKGIFSLQTGIQYYTAGARYRYKDILTIPGETGFYTVDVDIDGKIKADHLAIPLFVQASLTSGMHRIGVGAGPVFSYGVYGKSHIEMDVTPGGTVTGRINLFTKDTYELDNNLGAGFEPEQPDKPLLKRFNPGLGSTIAYEYRKKYQLALSYFYGQRDISNDPDEKLHSHVFSLTLGYRFK